MIAPMRGWVSTGLVAVACAGWLAAPPASAELPSGYRDATIVGGLKEPTSVAFSRDGRMFVTEKRGVLLSARPGSEKGPRVVADLRTQVHSFNERGLLSVAVDPAFPKRPYLYVGYTHDAPLGGTAPTWGRPGKDRDRCFKGKPDPAYEIGCPVSSRVSRLTLAPDGGVSETVLLEDWCQQFPSHSIGDLVFDRTGALLVGGGDGAAYQGLDVGTRGQPFSSCAGDPVAEGGALRAQDLTTSGDPVTLDGTIARIDPMTGAAALQNPLASAGGGAARIISYGLRNPYRFALRPGRNELWIGDVGWNTFEEINVTRTDQVENFGWPCFEGRAPSRYARVGSPICGGLYAKRKSVSGPFFAYPQRAPVVRGEECVTAGASAISGIAFDAGTSFPAPLDGALFFADYIRGCIWAFPPRRFGAPHLGSLRVFQTRSRFPVDLVKGPDGLYYANIVGGTVQRVSFVRPTVETILRTKPRGLSIGFDGRIERDGTAITIRTGSEHRLSAAARIRSRGKRLRFVRWADSGERVRDVAPRDRRTFTAIYRRR